MPYTPIRADQPPPTFLPTVEVRGFSYEDRQRILAALAEEMSQCGCWLLDRKALSMSQMQYQFELQLRGVFDLYTGLIASGLELTRSSHLDLTGLCTLRKHNLTAASLGRVIAVQLEVSFLAGENEPLAAPASAFA